MNEKNTWKNTFLHRFHKTFRKYWSVVVPVHLISSAVWFGGCYYASEKGYNILKTLERLRIKEEIINFFTHSSMGHLTVTIALYKLVSPFRYITTFVASIYLIRAFKRAGFLQSVKKPFLEKRKKPPSKDEEC